MKIKKWLLILCLCVITTGAYAQTEEEIQRITENYDKELLLQMLDEAIAKEKELREYAYQYAEANNIPLKLYNEDGSYAELQEIDSEGKPQYYSTSNTSAAVSTRVNYLNSGGGLGLNLDGQNMYAFVWDNGIARTTHQAFDGPGGSNRAFSFDGTSTYLDHATHVTGTIIASGQYEASAKGMAWKGRAANSDWGSDFSEAISAGLYYGMLVSNHSYGALYTNVSTTYIGKYTQKSKDWDALMYEAPYYLQVVSAGNDGNNNSHNTNPLGGNSSFDKLSGFKVSKNNLVVANGSDANIDTQGNLVSVFRSGSSSEGPTDDYRIKPDIMGNGSSLYSTTDASNSSYGYKSGTSMAAPNVTGSLLLLQEHYRNTHGFYMKAATLKGLALHTADDVGMEGPDAEQGWGLLNTKKAAEIISVGNSANRFIKELQLKRREVLEFEIEVPCEGASLTASISWTDYPGDVNTGGVNDTTAALVNDLDIRVEGQQYTYTPWKLTGVNSNARGDNAVDPFERVDIQNASGTYKIIISHKGDTLKKWRQDFTLIVSQEPNDNFFETANYDRYNQVLGDGAGVHTYPTLVGDFNADGKDDLAFIGQNWSGVGLNIRTKFSNGNGTWSPANDIQGDGAGVHTYPALVGDMNGDGKDDIVFVGQNWSGAGLNIRTKFSNGDGTYTHAATVHPDGAGVHTYPALVGDMNGDGRDDLVFIGQNWSGAGLNIRTKFSNGDGTYTHTSQILGDGLGVHTYPTLVGDVNGDGKTDLVFVGQNWSGAGLNIRTKFSNGDGTYTPATEILADGAGVHTYPSFIGDVDGDGKDDLVFVGQNWNGAGLNIRTKFSNGNGTWTPAAEVQGDGAGIHQLPTLSGDFNGDCKMDLLFSWNHPQEGLQVRTKLSNGDGTWQHNSDSFGDGYCATTYPMLIGDISADGKDDIIMVGQNWSGAGLNIRSRISLFTGEPCEECPEGPVAVAKFENINKVRIIDSFYGPQYVYEMCKREPITVNGMASQCEDRYFLEVVEFDLMSWSTVGMPLYSDWVCTACTVPSALDITDYVPLSALDPSKIYKFKLAVGNPWHETNMFFSVVHCKKAIDGKSTESIATTGTLEETLAEEPIVGNEVSVYPNPTTNDLNVISKLDTISKVALYDLLGNKVYENKLANGTSLQIDLKALASGMYLLHIQDSKGNTITLEKIIKL